MKTHHINRLFKKVNNPYGLLNKKRLFATIDLVVLFLILLTSACKKFVTVDPPISRLVTKSVFKDNSTAIAAQLTIYSEMSSSMPYNMCYYPALSADELFTYTTNTNAKEYYINALKPVDEQASLIWTPAYNYIYQANAIIEGLQNNSGVSTDVSQQLIGESEFIRAFWHFYLTNLFGDIPLITKTDYTINGTISRAKQTVVYQQIITDLIDAQKKLNSNYVDGTSINTTDERVRPTKWAATALLARVYLYTGDYANASLQATDLINNAAEFGLVDDLNSVFLKNSREAIWQLQAIVAGFNTTEGKNYILTGPPTTGTANSSAISMQLLNAFESGDKRKLDWINSTSANGNTYYFPYKYKVRASSDVTEYSMVLRLAEQYLIRAEAEANGTGSDISAAINDLNAIRNRAGLPNYSGSTDKQSVLSAILHERQVELFTEWGARWFDLKRTGAVDSVMSIVTPLKSGVWNSNYQLYPIPQTEIINDPNLKQNPGYN